jgi:hypothetical protein
MRQLAASALALALPYVLAPGQRLAAQEPSDLYLVHVRSTPTGLVADSVRRLTDRAGYDNQPYFTPDGRAVFFTSIDDAGQADIFRIDLASSAARPVTRTAPESEYSATPMPGGDRFSVIRVEADSTQRLWSFAMNGTDPRLVLEEVAPVGYHAWLDRYRLALFVLGSPATLQLADVRTGASRVVSENIGRSVHRVPGRDALSFVHRTGPQDPGTIEILDPATGETESLVNPFPENEYHAWLRPGVIVTARDSRLYTYRPGSDTDWVAGPDLSEFAIHGVSRIAVAPSGTAIVVVAAR